MDSEVYDCIASNKLHLNLQSPNVTSYVHFSFSYHCRQEYRCLLLLQFHTDCGHIALCEAAWARGVDIEIIA